MRKLPKPEQRNANPEPMIPEPKMAKGSAALRISYGGCEWCGKPASSPNGTSCIQCGVREQEHRKRVNKLTERKLELEIQLMENQLGK